MRLDQYLKTHNVRASHLARAIGVSHSTIIRIARGEWEPRPLLRAKIIQATGGIVEAADLILPVNGVAA